MRQYVIYTFLGLFVLSNFTSSKKYKASLAKLDTYEEQINRLKKDSLELADQADELTLMLGNVEQEKKELLVDEAQLDLLKEQVTLQNEHLHMLKSTILNSLVYFDMNDLELYVRHGKVYISLSDGLLFNSGSVRLDRKGKKILNKIGEVLQHHPHIHILVEGHTDNVPVTSNKRLYKDNWELSTARATAVARILSQGEAIAPERISIVGKGEFSPKASNETAEGRKLNRRTEIILSPRLEELIETVVYDRMPARRHNMSKEQKTEERKYTAPRGSRSKVSKVDNSQQPEQVTYTYTYSVLKTHQTPYHKENEVMVGWVKAARKQLITWVHYFVDHPIWHHTVYQIGELKHIWA
ncbi:MAG: flagellar motor protein MotB [Thermonemataceae bacterium]